MSDYDILAINLVVLGADEAIPLLIVVFCQLRPSHGLVLLDVCFHLVERWKIDRFACCADLLRCHVLPVVCYVLCVV